MAAVALDPGSLYIWKANMEEMERRQPELAEKLRRWAELNGHAFAHDESPSGAGAWVSGLTREPFFQPLQLPTLSGAARNQKNQKNEEKDISLIFMYGIGAGVWPFVEFGEFGAFDRSGASPVGVLVLEPYIALLAYLLHTTLVYQSVPEGCCLSFAVEADERAMEEALRANAISPGPAARAEIWEHPGEAEAFGAGMAALRQTLAEQIAAMRQGPGSQAEEALLCFRRIALAAPWIVFGPSLSSISKAYRGRPFIWADSELSLEKNVRLLKENAGRAVIICPDTAALELLELGIIPHIVAAAASESGARAYDSLERVWTQYPEEAEKILLVCQPACGADTACGIEAIGKWPGPKIVIGRKEEPADSWLAGELLGGDLVYSGTRSSHMGERLASVMGASTLVMTGRDNDAPDSSFGPFAGFEKFTEFAEIPAALAGNAGRKTPEERGEAAGEALKRIGEALDYIKSARAALAEIVLLAERAEPGAKIYADLDVFHRGNPVLGFIGRTWTALNARAVHAREIPAEMIEDHRAALDFMETWLMYAASAVEKINVYWDKGYSIGPLPFLRVSDPKPYEDGLMVAGALEQLDKLADSDTREKVLSAHVLLDNLLARADHKWWRFWDRRIDWKLALVMEQAGRNAEAESFIRRMEQESMEVFGLPHEAAAAFLKDAARVLSSSGVCYKPDFSAARLYAQNALSLSPGDEDAARVLSEVNDRTMRYYSDILLTAKKPGIDTPQSVAAEWGLERARAEKAVADRNLAEAFDITWNMVKKFILTVPEGASDYLEWLTEHIARAEEKGLAAANVPEIKREIHKWMPLFRETGARVSPKFGHIAEETATENGQPLAEQG